MIKLQKKSMQIH